jgi:deazaflavin-dependent oxidoreductase (nitroreductase family)
MRATAGRMSQVRRRFTSIGNRFAVWLYRRFDGRMSSAGKDVHVLLITAPGRRSGIPRSTCVRYLSVPEGIVVWGTGSGSTRDPEWFRNVRAAGAATVQVGTNVRHVQARELTGDERDAVWNDVVLKQIPGVQRYAQKAERTIPVALLVQGDQGNGGLVGRD